MESGAPLTIEDSLNRYSMPVTRTKNPYDVSLDQTNTTRFLFGEEDDAARKDAFSQGSAADEAFPTLVRQNDQMVCLLSDSLTLPGFFIPTSVPALRRLGRLSLWPGICGGNM